MVALREEVQFRRIWTAEIARPARAGAAGGIVAKASFEGPVGE
jgi:hypothetical protein